MICFLFEMNYSDKEVKKMEKNYQMSESFLLASLLAIVGGFLDAYSYVCRDHVFANAQTGNIVKLDKLDKVLSQPSNVHFPSSSVMLVVASVGISTFSPF